MRMNKTIETMNRMGNNKRKKIELLRRQKKQKTKEIEMHKK